MSLRNSKNVSGGSFAEVFRIALPLILSNSCHAVNMFTDRLMLTHFSREAVAAAFTGGLTNFTISCIFVGTIGYTGTFVAQYEGAGRRDRIGSAVWQGIWLSVFGGLLLLTGLFWARPMFELFGHDPAVTEQETTYFQILCRGGIVYLLIGAVSSFWTGRGKTALVLAVSFIITLFNLPLNYIFIFGKLGLRPMGIAGAAWGTVLSALIGLVIYFALFFSPEARRNFATGRAAVDSELLRRMIHYGLPNGIQLALDLLAFNTFSLLLGCYGVAVHEASSIAFGINNIAFCPIIGIGMTVSILAGQGVGAGNIPFARKSLRNGMIIVMVYTLIMILLFTVFQRMVLAPFVRSGDPEQAEAIRMAGIMLCFISFYLLFDGVNITVSNALRGAGDTRFPMWTITVVGLLGFAAPCLLLYFMKQPWWSLWLALVAEVILLSVIFSLRYLGGKWTRMRVIEEAAVIDAEEFRGGGE